MIGRVDEEYRYDNGRRHCEDEGQLYGYHDQYSEHYIDDNASRYSGGEYYGGENRFSTDRFISGRHTGVRSVVSRLDDDVASRHSRGSHESTMSVSRASRHDMDQPARRYISERDRHPRYRQEQGHRDGGYDDEWSRRANYDSVDGSISQPYSRNDLHPSEHSRHAGRSHERRRDNHYDSRPRQNIGNRHSRQETDYDESYDSRRGVDPTSGSRRRHCVYQEQYQRDREGSIAESRRSHRDEDKYETRRIEDPVIGSWHSHPQERENRVERRRETLDGGSGRHAHRGGNGHTDSLYEAKLKAYGADNAGGGVDKGVASLKSDDTEGEVFVDIGFNTKARLRRAKDTMEAIARDFYAPATCFACASDLFCIADVQYIVCPKCKTVSPADQTESGGQGGTATSFNGQPIQRHDVGLGFTSDTLFKMQSDLGQRAHSPKAASLR